MERMLSEVERVCSKELAAFVECVDSNPTSWQQLCGEKQRGLSACARAKVQGVAAVNKVSLLAAAHIRFIFVPCANQTAGLVFASKVRTGLCVSTSDRIQRQA